MIVPESVYAIDAHWLSAVLNRNISDFRMEGINESRGLLGQVTRVFVEGASYVVKLSSVSNTTNDEFAKALNLGEREWRFYSEVAPFVSIRVPRCYGSAFDPRTGRSALILEDLGSAPSREQLFGASLEEAQAVVSAAAQLHVQWSLRSDLDELQWLPRLNDPINRMMSALFEASWASFEERYGSMVPARTRNWLCDFAPTCNEFLDRSADLSTTLVHGDLRADNIVFTPDRIPALVDWQMAGRAEGVRDIAYFIGTSLRPEIAKRYVVPLVNRYSKETGFIWDVEHRSVWESFRECMLLSMVATVGGVASLDVSDDRSLKLQDETVRRMFLLGEYVNAGQFLPRWFAQCRS